MIEPDGDDAFLVSVGGAVQSRLVPGDPLELSWGYLRHIAAAVGERRPQPLDVVHVGGGAMMLARYFAHAHPGSRQVVIEPNKEMTATVLRRFPLPGDARISLLHNDGRTALGTIDSGTADLIVMDAYKGGHVPEELTTAECVEQLSRVLRDDGVLAFGLIDYPETEYVARVCATVRSASPLSVTVMSPHHEYFGNHTLLCTHPGVLTPRVLAEVKAVDVGYVMRSADWLDTRCAEADVLTDAAPAPSPDPPTEALGASW